MSNHRRWKEYCRKLAEKTALEPLLPSSFLPPELMREKKIAEMAEKLSSYRVIELLQEGINALKKSVDPADEAFYRELQGRFTAKHNISSLNGEFEAVEKALREKALQEENAPLLTLLAFCYENDARTWFHLAYILYRRREYAPARDVAEVALSLTKNQPEYAILLSLCCLALDLIPEAQTAYRYAEEACSNQGLLLSPEWEALRLQLHSLLE